MSLRFYVHEGSRPAPPLTALAPGLAVAAWRPRSDGLPPKDLALWPNAMWWVFDRMGVFANRHCGVLMIRDGDRLVHSALVTPRYFRFPQMGRDDLQIGGVWTDPARRGQGLAKAGVALIVQRWSGLYGRMWYIVEEDNPASIRVIEACGFRLLGLGERRSPLGVGVLGQYRLLQLA